MRDLIEHLQRIEEKLDALIQKRVPQQYYSTADAAEILDKAEFTVREWCRLGRVTAEKRATGRGNAREWMISHEELARIQSEGLLPANPFRGQNGGITGNAR